MKKWLLLSTVVMLCALASAQNATPFQRPYQNFVDASGNPCAGCSLFSYLAGTNTPTPTYKDSTKTTQNTNPVILNADGGAAIWMDPAISYKFVLQENGVTQWTVDNVPGNVGQLTGNFCALSGCTLTGSFSAPSASFGGTLSTNFFWLRPLTTMPATWTLDVTTPKTAFNSLAAQGGQVGGVGLLDWYDTTGQCLVNRGLVNVRDCGAVADGHWAATTNTVGTVISASGGAVTGTVGQTCTLTMSSSVNAVATATLNTANTLTGANFTVTVAGSGFASAPTTATLSNGTATCSGTPTIVSYLVGNWTGTDNYTAVHKAEAAIAANGGGMIYFPPSGTNIWMMGSASECTDTIGGTASNALFALANGTTIQGAGKNVTVIEALPTTGNTSACWMFGNSTVPAYNITFQDVRIDGNEPADATHNDLLHPNNNLGTNTNKLGAIFVQPTSTNITMLNTAATTIQRTQITGFTGVLIANSLIPNTSSFALWFGPYGRVYLADNDIYMNEWAGAIFTQAPDSTFYDNYLNQDNSWNAYPQVVELETGTVRWIHNYFGGGFGATYVGLGVRHNLYIDNINDFPGPGITAQCSNVTPVWGCGSNYIFADSSTPISSVDNAIIGGSITDTYANYPAVLLAGHTARTVLSEVDFNSSGAGNPVPTYLIQELNSASGTSVISPIIDETPSTGRYSFLAPGPVLDSAGLRPDDITLAVASFAVPANTCYGSAGSTTAATAAMTGVTTSMAVTTSYSATPVGVTGWDPSATARVSLAIWPSSANTLSYLVCNNTGGSITPSTITFNVSAK